jgi:dephospho-CoA kinase
LLRDHYGGDVFVNKVIDDVTTAINNNPAINIIITDVRYLNEFEALKKLGFTTVKITRDIRVINRDSNHTSETSLVGAKFDEYIDNNGTLQYLYKQVDDLIKKIITRDN